MGWSAEHPQCATCGSYDELEWEDYIPICPICKKENEEFLKKIKRE